MTGRIDLFKVAEVELIYTPNQQELIRPVVNTPEIAYSLFLNNWRRGTLELQESFYAMFLNNAKHVLGLAEISKGGSAATIVEPSLIFAYAIKATAKSIILAHNHPSGNLNASSADINLTKQLRNGGKLLGISVDDHLIVTRQGYSSIVYNHIHS